MMHAVENLCLVIKTVAEKNRHFSHGYNNEEWK